MGSGVLRSSPAGIQTATLYTKQLQVYLYGSYYQLLRTPSSDDAKINKSKTRDNMKCGPIVFLLLLPFICTFSEGKSCTGEILPKKILTAADNTADNTDSVRSCIKRGGKCCSLFKDGDFVTWDGGSDIKDICDMCWAGKSRTDNYEKLGWLGEKVLDVALSGCISFGMGKMWAHILPMPKEILADAKISLDWMWRDWSGTKKQ